MENKPEPSGSSSPDWKVFAKQFLGKESPELKSIPRDFILVRSPNYVSWQLRAAQENPQLELFHQDVIDIPVFPSLIGKSEYRLKNKYENWLRPYYLQSITRDSVDKLLRKHFKLSMPLDGESSADHWVPHGNIFNVEVRARVWENRLALFFDGNVENSVNRFTSRLEMYVYDKSLTTKILGERYLEIWRKKWTKTRGSMPQTITEKESTEEHPSSVLEKPAIPVGIQRGRQRRAALRQLHLGHSSKSPAMDRPPTAGDISYDVEVTTRRGRARRRERRQRQIAVATKEKGARKKVTKSISSKMAPTFDIQQDSHKISLFWQYHSGEVAAKGSLSQEGSNFPTKMRIEFGQTGDSGDLDVKKHDSQAREIRGSVPHIRFLPLTELSSSKTRRYHLISYCNRTPDYAQRDLTDEQEERKYNSEETAPLDYEIHVADIIDEADFIRVGDQWYDCFLTLVQGDPDFPRILSPMEQEHGPSLQRVQHVKRTAEPLYWHRFNILLYGLSKEDQLRELPFSRGYGIFHNKPHVAHRENRWGYLNPDKVLYENEEQPWRPSLNFQLFREGLDECKCHWTEATHDVDICKHLGKDIIGGESWGQSKRLTPLYVLDNVLFLSRRPYEAVKRHQLKYSSLGDIYVPDDSVACEDATDPIVHLQLNTRVIFQKLSETEISDKDLNSAMYLLLGLGVKQDLSLGFDYLLKSAEGGSLIARALCPTIAMVYGLPFNVDKKHIDWLEEAARSGSKVAVRCLNRLNHRIDNIRSLQSFFIVYPNIEDRIKDGIEYHQHVKPYYDLEDLESLERVISKTLEEIKQLHNPRNANWKKNSREAMNGEIWESEIPAHFLLGSLLHLAALFGFQEAVLFLLDCGFDINGQSRNAALRTPLLCALHRGNVHIARLLIDKGAQPHCHVAFDESGPCASPSPLHYLVNVIDDNAAKELAQVLVRHGADINYKCDAKALQSGILSDAFLLVGHSVTPLRWAVINGRKKLVKALLGLGAKFAYYKYTYLPREDSGSPIEGPTGGLLLETPCTDSDILEMFFARARVPGLPMEFSQTPLGLLVSEDDGPHRRLRPGFERFENIREALVLLLELQPGFETEVLWSAVRHNHIDIVQFLILDLGWDAETRYLGLSMLHNAILYGRLEIVRFLLANGADPLARTENRCLTCYHLLMMVKRDPGTDHDLFELLSNFGIEIDAREQLNGLTAFHIAVRNQKLKMAEALLDRGADMHIAVIDKIDILSQGRYGFLNEVPTRPRVFGPALTVLGEVIIQFIQNNFYTTGFVIDLLLLVFKHFPQTPTVEDIMVDKDNKITLVHLLALTEAPDAPPRPQPEQWQVHGGSREIPPLIIGPHISLLQFVIREIPSNMLSVQDIHGDTALHYASAASQFHNIESLVQNNVDPSIRNNFGLNAAELMAWSVFFLGPKRLIHNKAYESWHPTRNGIYVGKGWQKRQKHPMNDLSKAFLLFENLGFSIDTDFRRLVMAWDFSIDRTTRSQMYYVKGQQDLGYFEIVPEKSAIGIEDDSVEESPSSSFVISSHKGKRRKYMLAQWTGPQRRRWWWEKDEYYKEIDWDDRVTLRKLEDERNAL